MANNHNNHYNSYYYSQQSQNYTSNGQPQTWSAWALENQKHNENYYRNNPTAAGAAGHNYQTGNNTQSTQNAKSTNNYYTANSRQSYPQSQRRFPSPSQYNAAPNMSNNWPQQQHSQRNNYGKRRMDSESYDNKGGKKKKKPLSQNIPAKKAWTAEEAEVAFNLEKDYNKRFMNQSLIIKFPDPEVNRDIVTKFHPAIENVHFQHPSIARYCFVTLDVSADPQGVIDSLNKTKFGDGYLTAEFKKEREEDQKLGPEDIDPLTLYVGNLAQDITKEDMMKTYPKTKRIDIGFAKRMKYTRYAFVQFKNVADSIEAFKRTHCTLLHAKSLIVRFRRLHGTVGMPGESKVPNPPKDSDSTFSDAWSETQSDFGEDSSYHSLSVTPGFNSPNSSVSLDTSYYSVENPPLPPPEIIPQPPPPVEDIIRPPTPPQTTQTPFKDPPRPSTPNGDPPRPPPPSEDIPQPSPPPLPPLPVDETPPTDLPPLPQSPAPPELNVDLSLVKDEPVDGSDFVVPEIKQEPVFISPFLPESELPPLTKIRPMLIKEEPVEEEEPVQEEECVRKEAYVCGPEGCEQEPTGIIAPMLEVKAEKGSDDDDSDDDEQSDVRAEFNNLLSQTNKLSALKDVFKS